MIDSDPIPLLLRTIGIPSGRFPLGLVCDQAAQLASVDFSGERIQSVSKVDGCGGRMAAAQRLLADTSEPSRKNQMTSDSVSLSCLIAKQTKWKLTRWGFLSVVNIPWRKYWSLL